MPAIAPGAEFMTTQTAATSSKSAAARSGASQTGSEQPDTDTANPRQTHSAFDALLGLATPPAANLPVRSPADTAGAALAAASADGAAGSGAASGLSAANGAVPGAGAGFDLNNAAPNGQTPSSPALPVAGQPLGTQAAGTPPSAEAPAIPNSAPAGETGPAGTAPANDSRETPANAAPDGARLASAGGWTSPGGPQFVGDIVANAPGGSSARATPPVQTAAVAGMPAFQAPPPGQVEGANQSIQTMAANSTAAATAAADLTAPATASPAAILATSAPAGPAAPTGMMASATPNAATTAPVAAATAGQPAAKPASAKSFGIDALAKAAPDSAAAAVTSNGDARAPAIINPATMPAGHAAASAETATPAAAASPDAKPPAMATVSAAATPPQSQASTTAPAAAVTAAPAPAGSETAKPADITASATTPATTQSQAAATASAAVAEANPAGRFAQARQGVDERDSGVSAARGKGKSAANGANQAGAKQQAAGTSPQPQPGSANAAAARPDTAMTSRDLPVAAPPPPAATALPLTTDGVRVSTVSIDPALTSVTDTSAGAVRGGSRSAADAGAAQTPRFTPHAANHLAGQISQRFANGSRVFGIRLDPAELGRVDIRLELGQNNRVHATLTVERGDTLAEMQRSTRDLERALNDAGLELAEDGLNFELSEGSGDDQSAESEQGDNINVYGQDDDGAQELGAEIDTGPADAYGFRLSRRDGVDLRV